MYFSFLFIGFGKICYYVVQANTHTHTHTHTHENNEKNMIKRQDSVEIAFA